MKNRLPDWLKQELPDTAVQERLGLLSGLKVNTVCSQARCPNLSSCFKNQRLTFMVLGDICTRNCRYCGVNKTRKTSLPLDKNEPYRISEVAKILNLKFVVITSVTRDDLPDGGAAQFAKTVRLIRAIDKDKKIEVLIPDFSGNLKSLRIVIASEPSILAHNIETVRRLYKTLRPKADYQISLSILKKAKQIKPFLITKSSLIVGFGETEKEVISVMEDLRSNQCDILTLGQYLSPTQDHYPVKEFISIEKFRRYQRIAFDLGFKSVLSGPKVRSSYQAEYLYNNV